jgi:hypothetical protein
MPGIHSAYNRNEYQKTFKGVPVLKADDLAAISQPII